MEKIVEKAQEYRDDVWRLGHAHFLKVQAAGRWRVVLGLPIVVLTAMISAGIFASIGKTAPTWAKVVGGTVATTVVVLSAIQAFFKFDDDIEAHKAAMADFKALARRLDLFILGCQGGLDRTTALVQLDSISSDMARTMTTHPYVSDSFFTRVVGRGAKNEIAPAPPIDERVPD